ncbi:hypothetical protein HYFRA_00000790 [Hymenoscyphus fraxineus]|uniref:Uncharacterized protein n=1 Tax=Hymenoscyphus fraxineus TaxID=746836 RepID=A0A9N9PGQ4_9HELO|nr:hypothetical protein HYFRA_00000790 [Hymenoscyphus fraxineus]
MTRPSLRMFGVELKHEANWNARSRRGAPARPLWPLALAWSREDDILNASPKPGVVHLSRMVGAEWRGGEGEGALEPSGSSGTRTATARKHAILAGAVAVALPCYFLADAGPQSRARGWRSED